MDRIELSIESDLLVAFAAKWYNHKVLKTTFLKTKLNFAYLGFGVEIKDVPPVTDLGTAIEDILDVIKKKNKKSADYN